MAKKKTKEELDLEEEEEIEEPDPNTSDDENDESGGESGNGNTDWQAAYKGQQKVTQKKQDQIDQLQDQLQQLTDQLEEAKSDKSASDSKVGDLQKQLETVSDKLKNVTAEKGSLDNTLARQKIVLEKHPTLAPFMQYIPEGDDLEQFEANAEEFAKTLGTFQEKTIQDDLEGATPPPPGGDATVSSSQDEKAWAKVTSLAGVRGKEKEYQEAYDEWLRIFDASNKN